MNYPDYDTLREQYEAGNISAVDFVIQQSPEITEDYNQFCHDEGLDPDSDNAAKAFMDFREELFEESIKKTIGDTSVSILILLLIGVMSSTWMISVVVPTLIYYGVQVITPSLFLPCACLISALVSLMTGTSWTTIATIGIALLGIGNALMQT